MLQKNVGLSHIKLLCTSSFRPCLQVGKCTTTHRNTCRCTQARGAVQVAAWAAFKQPHLANQPRTRTNHGCVSRLLKKRGRFSKLPHRVVSMSDLGKDDIKWGGKIGKRKSSIVQTALSHSELSAAAFDSY